MRSHYLLFLIVAVIVVGCSSDPTGDAMSPAVPTGRILDENTNHQLWGLWQVAADPSSRTMDIIPLRMVDFHLNVLPFLEPPPLLNLTLESLEFNGNIIEADIGLRHPFLGLTEFTGFDVCGILITNGSVSGFNDTDLIMAGPGDTRLLNPDGLARWWNPAEFPADGTISGYKDGLLGTPDSFADFNSTINGYKFFCDDLTSPEAPVSGVDPASRCVFSPGQKNVRHYTIELGAEGLIFNYAVDACWRFPNGDPPWQAPDDFAPEANRAEAWNISITELENSLWNDGASSGGNLSLLIDVWDHYNAGLNTLWADSPGNVAFTVADPAAPGGAGYSTYQVDITGATPAEGSIDVLIGVECEEIGYQELLPGKTVTAYFLHAADVMSSLPIVLTAPNGGEEWTISTHEDITWDAPGSITNVKLEYSKDSFVSDINTIIDSTENDGEYDWTIPDDPSDTVRVRVSDVDTPAVSDISDDDFSIVELECGTGLHSNLIYSGYFGNFVGPWPDRMFDIACLSDGRVLMKGGSYNLYGFDVTQNGNITGDVIISNMSGGGNPILSMDVCEITGNIVYVAGYSSNTIHVYNSSGVFVQDVNISSSAGLHAVDTDGDGGIWVYYHNAANQAILAHYTWDGSTYTHQPSHDLNITAHMSNVNYIFDMAIVHGAERLIILEQGPYPWRGVLLVYDISGGQPVYLPSMKQSQFFPQMIGAHGYSHWRTAVDIEVDHSDSVMEFCRIICMERCQPWSMGTYFVKFDADMNHLANQHIAGNWTHQYMSFTINQNPDDPDGIFIVGHEDGFGGEGNNEYETYEMPADW